MRRFCGGRCSWLFGNTGSLLEGIIGDIPLLPIGKLHQTVKELLLEHLHHHSLPQKHMAVEDRAILGNNHPLAGGGLGLDCAAGRDEKRAGEEGYQGGAAHANHGLLLCSDFHHLPSLG